MKRLLCVLSSMNAGGAETFLMKIYRTIDRSKYQMDFCINVKEKCFYEDEIMDMGGMIHRIPSKSEGVGAFKRALTKIVRDNGYQYVLRITSNAAGFLDLKIAKKSGATVCIARSSNSSDGNSLKAKIAHRLGRALYEKFVDVKIAPSDLAAKYTFGDASNVHILHNALDLSVFHYRENGRAKVRNEYGFSPEDIVIGHIGRLSAQKNHMFLLEVFSKLHQQNAACKLLLIGKGELEDSIRQRVKDLQLEDAVVFGGVREDIPDVLSAMDVFLFPSLYEGMPNTVIEAQAMGLPVVLADTITKEADITGLLEYRSLAESSDIWAKAVISKMCIERTDHTKDFKDNRYDIQSVVEQFITLVF